MDESDLILEYIINQLDADANRIGVMGSSMGGFTAAGIFIKNLNLKSLVVFNGACAWVKTEEIFRKMEKREPLSIDEKKSY